MGLIKIYQGKSKPAKKKPGWQERAAAEVVWLKGIQAMTVTHRQPKQLPKSFQPVQVVVSAPVVSEDCLNRPPSLMTFGGAGTKPVARPDILYKDDPIMLARELKARERKFATAPAYNKGGDVLITDEMMKDITAGKTRRR
jgi:hypothetical protein